MRFEPTAVDGAFVISSSRADDERGWFARAYDQAAFERQGISFEVSHVNLSHNRAARTLRGLHYQEPPSLETKLVTCIRGAVFDVVADIRPGSPSAYRWFGLELRAGDNRSLFVPAGCAHGFLTLEDDSDLMYLMGDEYRPELARVIRWDDPVLNVEWPHDPVLVSERDALGPNLYDSGD